MELSCKHFFAVIQENQFSIIKLSIIKEIENIELKIEYHKITSKDIQIVKNLYSNCINNPTNKNLLNTISHELVNSSVLNYGQCENLRNNLEYIKNRDINEKILIKTQLYNELILPLTIRNIKGIYEFIYSFCMNYNILESMIHFIINNLFEQRLELD